jgi:ATP-dependent protease Clp ATPase subunit
MDQELEFELIQMDEGPSCSFCLKGEGEIAHLIVTPAASPVRAFICNECVEACHSVLSKIIPQPNTAPDPRDSVA